MHRRGGRRCDDRGLTDSKQQQSAGRCSAQSRCFGFIWAEGADKQQEGRARALSRASSAGALALRTRLSNPKLSSIQLPNIQSITTSSSPLSSSRHPEPCSYIAPSHYRPHYSHTTTDTTMADKFPSVEDLDSGIPLHLDHNSQNLD